MDVSAGSAASLTVQSLSLRIAAKAISLGCACHVCSTQTNKDKFLPEIADQKLWRPTSSKGADRHYWCKSAAKGLQPCVTRQPVGWWTAIWCNREPPRGRLELLSPNCNPSLPLPPRRPILPQHRSLFVCSNPSSLSYPILE